LRQTFPRQIQIEEGVRKVIEAETPNQIGFRNLSFWNGKRFIGGKTGKFFDLFPV